MSHTDALKNRLFDLFAPRVAKRQRDVVFEALPSMEEKTSTGENLRDIALGLAIDIHNCEDQREKFEVIFDHMPQAIYVCTLDTHIVLYANPTLVLTVGAVVGKKCYEVFQALSKPCDFCTNKYITNGQPIYNWQHYNKKLDRWFEITDSLIDWPGHGQARLEVATEVTHQKEVQEALRHKEIEARALSEASQCGIIFHRGGKALIVNRAFTKISGYSKQDLLDAPNLIDEIFIPEDQEMVRKMVLTEDEDPYTATIIRKDGKRVRVFIKASYQPYNGDPKKARVAVFLTHEYVERLAKDVQRRPDR